MTRQPARVITLRLCGAAADMPALAGRGRVPDRPVRLDQAALVLSLRAGESG